LGARLASEILKRGQLNGQSVSEVVIADLLPALADLLSDPRVKA
jgi:D-erythronate 2-dehydrogenase